MTKSKYNAKKIKIDSYTFDSKVESEYYLCLKDLKINNKIKDFELQPKFLLQEQYKKCEENIRAIYYIADFKIIHFDGTIEVIDIKGMSTVEAKLKRKLFMFKYPDLKLTWLVYVKKRGGWIDYFDNEKMKRKEKKK